MLKFISSRFVDRLKSDFADNFIINTHFKLSSSHRHQHQSFSFLGRLTRQINPIILKKSYPIPYSKAIPIALHIHLDSPSSIIQKLRQHLFHFLRHPCSCIGVSFTIVVDLVVTFAEIGALKLHL